MTEGNMQGVVFAEALTRTRRIMLEEKERAELCNRGFHEVKELFKPDASYAVCKYCRSIYLPESTSFVQ